MTPEEEQRAIGDVIDRVAGRLPSIPRQTIEATVEQHHHEFDERPIRDYVPLFVERDTIRTLATQAPAVLPSASVLDLPADPTPDRERVSGDAPALTDATTTAPEPYLPTHAAPPPD
jgi:hypothetical protein